MKAGNAVAILMSVRDEESYIDFNISYHLDLGFDYIFIANHCSTDNTNNILDSYKDDSRVIVIEETDPVFDHAKITNKLLSYAKTNYKVDWFIFLDADEFLSIQDKTIHDFTARLEQRGIPYATVGWANALFDYTLTDYTCSPMHPIDTTKYFYPWPEKEWQEYGHFRKAIVKNHDNMEIVPGGHYVRTENNNEFFDEYHWKPFIVPRVEARLLHFEFRDKAEALYEKWKKLASFEHDSTSAATAPWLERIRTIRKYVDEFKDDIETINKRWFLEHRTFWGTIIPKEKIVYDTTLSIWYRKYFRRKIEGGNVNSVGLVRSGHLGDVIMAEPIARFLSKYVRKVCLATEIENSESLFSTYHKIYTFEQVKAGAIDCDLMIKLVYEYSDNQKTYIEGYMESIGFGNMKIAHDPEIKGDWKPIIKDEYILIAPFTSEWEEKKRNWGYEKFIELSKLLEVAYNSKCVLLEKHYSFKEMMSLIRNCKVFIGNDSGPAVIAQSFNKVAFIIFGATRPEYMQVSKSMIPIYDKNRHALCSHTTRAQEIDCCEDFCMDKITVEDVFNKIKLTV